MLIPEPSLNELEQLQPIAQRICQLADQDLLIHPENGFIPNPPITLAIYQHVRIFAGGFAGFYDFPSNGSLNKEVAVASILYKIRFLIGLGLEKTAENSKYLKSEIADVIPVADILDTGLREAKWCENQPGTHCVYFFVLALEQLTHFVDSYNNAYRFKSQLRRAEERISSRDLVISAIALLSLSQLALEKGLQYQTISLANNKLNELNQAVENFKEQEAVAASNVGSKKEEYPCPIGGDSLTPIIWEICSELHAKRMDVKPRTVMRELKGKAQSRVPPLIDEVAGGVCFETLDGEQKELNSQALTARIKEWRKALEKIRG